LAFILPMGNSNAELAYLAPETGAQIAVDDVQNQIRSNGVVINLPKGERFSQGDFEITATTNSQIYVSGNENALSSAVLDGIIENSQNQRIDAGEVFVFDVQSQKTQTHSFDTKHFLDKTGFIPTEETQTKLKKISKTQSFKKSMGLLKGESSDQEKRTEAVDNIVALLGQRNIIDFKINENQMDLEQFQEFALTSGLPLHILVSWGASLSDIDLHLTGPGETERFHVYYLTPGDLDSGPEAALIKDCVSTRCSEVIRIENVKENDVYRASVYNLAAGAEANNDLSSSDVEIELILGGTPIAFDGASDLGTKVSGGDSLFKATADSGEMGNTWQAFEIDAGKNEINAIDNITNFDSSGDVQ